jgi:hypothetical protein
MEAQDPSETVGVDVVDRASEEVVRFAVAVIHTDEQDEVGMATIGMAAVPLP